MNKTALELFKAGDPMFHVVVMREAIRSTYRSRRRVWWRRLLGLS